MEAFEEQVILDSFEIIIDTREQPTKKAEERYKAFEVPHSRHTLSYGDYTYNLTLPGGKLHDTSVTVQPPCIVERKMDLDELAMCFTRSRARFQAEFERAKQNNARIYLLVENGSWEKLIGHKYRSKYNPVAFLASLTAWMVRYDLQVIFCSPLTSGRMIKELLYRDAKERLERGEFG